MPRTKAGRALLAEYDDPEAPIYPPRESDIDAIEREAAQQERERIRREVGLDAGWEQRPVGPAQGIGINPFDLDAILAEPSE